MSHIDDAVADACEAMNRPETTEAERKLYSDLIGSTLPAVMQGKPPAKPVAVPESLPVDMPAFGQLATAIAAVMGEIGVVAKEGTNDFHNYKYVKMEDLLQRATPLLAKHGVVVFQSELERTMLDDGKVMAVKYGFTVVHKSGEMWPERLFQTGSSACRHKNGGFDDKSLNKCHTAARKYFLLALLQIPTGDEQDDADAGEVPEKLSKPEQPKTYRRKEAADAENEKRMNAMMDELDQITQVKEPLDRIYAHLHDWYRERGIDIAALGDVFEAKLRKFYADTLAVVSAEIDRSNSKKPEPAPPPEHKPNGISQRAIDARQTPPRLVRVESADGSFFDGVEWLKMLTDELTKAITADDFREIKEHMLMAARNKASVGDWDEGARRYYARLKEIELSRV
jgi:hypothetical protein